MSEDQLMVVLRTFLLPQFEEVLFRCDVESAISSAPAPIAQRAEELVTFMGGKGRLEELEAVLGEVCPGHRGLS